MRDLNELTSNKKDLSVDEELNILKDIDSIIDRMNNLLPFFVIKELPSHEARPDENK